jgi:branched-chain amino acid transport system substrate-binding protein
MWAVSLVGGALLGCTLQTTDVVECRSNVDCRGAFGVGFECNADGFCQEAAVASRCEQTFPPDLFEQSDIGDRYVIIGSIEQRSEDIFRSFERATQLAFTQANDSGGVNSFELAAVFCTIDDSIDDGLDLTEAAVANADYLVNVLGVPAIVGPARSSVTQAVFQSLVAGHQADLAAGIERDGTLLITPSATSNALSDLDQSNPSDETPGLLWRTAPPDSLQGFAIATDMGLEGLNNGRTTVVDNVAVIFEEGPYGDGLAQAFGDEFTGTTISLFPFNNATARDDAVAAVAADQNIEEVLFVSGTIEDSTEFFNAAAMLPGFDNPAPGKGIFVPDAAATSDVLAAADTQRFDQTRGSRPAPLDKNQDLVFADFLAKYLREFGEDAEQFSFTANAYDAAWLAAYGVAWAILQEDRVSGLTMARGLRRLSMGTTVNVGPLNWTAVIQQFREGGTVNIQGASGDLDYDPATEETKTPIEIWEIVGTSATGIYSIEPP